MRFCKPDSDWQRLAAALKASRQIQFGTMQVDKLQLLWGDWYASANRVRVLEEFPLVKVAP
jgi:hypothetical protein